MPRSPAFLTAAIIALITLIVSGIAPKERLTWFLEAGPVIILLPVLWVRNKKFPLTPMLYLLLAFHAVVLCVGAQYTYAEVPLGDWVRDHFHLSRNPYDKLGHIAQGFVPAILLREVFLRRGVLRRDAWLAPIVIGVCLGFSALYEMVEWIVALILGQSSDAFLGTQGDPWDTQSDMACAGVGAAIALLVLSRWHDRQLGELPPHLNTPAV